MPFLDFLSFMPPQPLDAAFSSKGIDIILSPASRRHSVGSERSNSSPTAEPTPKSTAGEEMTSTDARARERGSLDLVVKMATEAANATACFSGKAGGSSTNDSETLWQGRCMELEESLQKFRDQAQNIRELLREKVRLE